MKRCAVKKFLAKGFFGSSYVEVSKFFDAATSEVQVTTTMICASLMCRHYYHLEQVWGSRGKPRNKSFDVPRPSSSSYTGAIYLHMVMAVTEKGENDNTSIRLRKGPGIIDPCTLLFLHCPCFSIQILGEYCQAGYCRPSVSPTSHVITRPSPSSPSRALLRLKRTRAERECHRTRLPSSMPAVIHSAVCAMSNCMRTI